MKLGTLSKDSRGALPEIPRADVRILWANDFYDGPLQGMAEVYGTRYLFDVIERDTLGTENESRAFWLIFLRSDQLQDEEAWHDLFCRKVGTHFDFTGRPAPRSEDICMEEFYEPYQRRPQPDYSGNDVIGWFR
jgi:hypothetical protein